MTRSSPTTEISRVKLKSHQQNQKATDMLIMKWLLAKQHNKMAADTRTESYGS
jgi:hypothetical protein